MANGDYWIKWYHEILDDPKMATLPDRLWRRFSEVCLLTGRLFPDKSGKLPDTRQIAWALRMPTDDCQIDLEQLASVGLLESIPNGWLVVNFQKRQQAASSTERVRQHRERKQREQYYANETNSERNVSQSRDRAETETEAEAEYPRSLEVELYHEVTGLYPTYMDEDKVKTKITDIRKKFGYPPKEIIKQKMLDKYSLWKSSTTKDGRPYNPSNPDWLDWVITDYCPSKIGVLGKPKRILTGPNGERIEDSQ